MERRTFETPLGEVWLWGSAEAFGGSGPVALVIRGAMSGPHDFEWWRPEGLPVIFAHLPGFHCPVLIVSSMGAFIAAFRAAMRAALPGREVILVGASVGAIVATGLRLPQITAKVLIEPFYSSLAAPELIASARALLETANAPYRRWVWSVLGIGLEGCETRNYAHLIGPDVPTVAIVGDRGYSTADDRQRLERAGVRLLAIRSGHDVAADAPEAMDEALRRTHEGNVDAADAASGARSRGCAGAAAICSARQA